MTTAAAVAKMWHSRLGCVARWHSRRGLHDRAHDQRSTVRPAATRVPHEAPSRTHSRCGTLTRMRQPLPISRIAIWPLSIPMRRKFRHATSERSHSEPIVVEIELADGTRGYGETHARSYVTGETPDGVIETIQRDFVPTLVETRPATFGEAIEVASELPASDAAGAVATAARAAVELALLDAYSRAFERSMQSLAGWLEDTDLGAPGSSETVRYGAVIGSVDPRSVLRSIGKMRLVGIRDYKVKVGDEGDSERVAAVVKRLGGGLRSGRFTLRLDANGAWSYEQARQRLRQWRDLPITCVEQPLAAGDIEPWRRLAKETDLPLMADESLITFDDGEAHVVKRGASWFNLRISKNGGLIPTLRLATLARRHGLAYQLGCMVGETSILSAAGRWFLQLVPDVRFAEGSYGRFLLRDGLTSRPLRFGYGGRWKPLDGFGLGIDVDASRLDRLSAGSHVGIQF